MKFFLALSVLLHLHGTWVHSQVTKNETYSRGVSRMGRRMGSFYTERDREQSVAQYLYLEGILRNVQEGLTAEKSARVQLEDAVDNLKETLTECQRNKRGPIMKCESGLIHSDYCNPPLHSCFNKQKVAGFQLNFTSPPAVSLGFIHLDLSNGANTRISTTSDILEHEPQVTRESVTIQFHCWIDSQCYMATISWMACGLVQR